MSSTAAALLAACALASACERGRLAINPQRDAAVSAEVSPPSADAVQPTYRESTLHFVEISASGADACGITTDASIECWGSVGECRDQEGECSAAHGCRVKPISGTWKQVSVDLGNGCAIDAADEFACWGCLSVFPRPSAGHSRPCTFPMQFD